MLFILITIVFVVIFSLEDTSAKELQKDKETYERIMGRKYD